MPNTQVLIVGAGPVGLFMAAELIRYGISCRIIDKNQGPSGQTRAAVIHPRTLEILDTLKLSEKFISAGVICTSTATYTKDLYLLKKNTATGLDSRFPFRLSLQQFETERILTEHLADQGLNIEWNTELKGLRQDSHSVIATLEAKNRFDESLTVDYLIGCDGARSTVRHLLDIRFTGLDDPSDFIIADVKIDWKIALPANETCFFSTPEGHLFYTPFVNGRSLIAANIKENQVDHSPSDLPSVEDFQSLIDARTPGGLVYDPSWRSHYRVHFCEAERFQVGRVFLAGDSAHIQSPAGGLGMNTGMQDAHNLGWKIGLVLNAKSPESILSSYNIERQGVVKDMLSLSYFLHHVQLEGQKDWPMPPELLPPELIPAEWLPASIRQEMTIKLSKQEKVQEHIQRTVAQLSINYRHSDLVAEHWTNSDISKLCAGDRAPCSGILINTSEKIVNFSKLLQTTKYVLLLFTGKEPNEQTYKKLSNIRDTISTSYNKNICVHIISNRTDKDILFDSDGTIHRLYGANKDCLYLIRPDGYIGYRNSQANLDLLFAYLKIIFS